MSDFATKVGGRAKVQQANKLGMREVLAETRTENLDRMRRGKDCTDEQSKKERTVTFESRPLMWEGARWSRGSEKRCGRSSFQPFEILTSLSRHAH